MTHALTRKNGSAAKAWLQALELTSPLTATSTRTFPVIVEELGAKFGEAPALIAAHESLSHANLAARVNQVARWALAQGIQKGDRVCLLMPNCPDYLAIWLGLTRIGSIVALLNINLKQEALHHCVTLAAPKHIIVAEKLAANLLSRANIWRYGPAFRQFLECFSGAPLSIEEHCDVRLNDPALLIYTSGTTGLPKAANVSHYRVMSWTHWFAGMMATGPGDRLYDCLPMYHSVGGIVAPGAALVGGGAVILREKFSARAFWDDIVDSGATIFQYIGELCRYLLAAKGDVPSHKLRLAVGNGLSGEIWPEFQRRFDIPQILEFYAATEGNFSLYNAEGKIGSIGRVPAFLAHRFPTAIVKFDPVTGEPERTMDGYCIPVTRGETGEAIGKITKGSANFEGYTDANATARKILRNVFEPGDAWVRSGDLMRQDMQGFFYFVDRVGDTFRWKGENVATTEVAAVAASAPGVKAATVYGVTIKGHSGRCGMAALDVMDDFDLNRFCLYIDQRLPAYARPLFLRIVTSLTMTDTFKHKKNTLAEDGFDPSVIKDPLFANCGMGYVPLDSDLYARINSGLIRL